MSQTTINFTLKKNGVLYDATSVLFQSPAGVSPAFGLKRTDTNAIIVAAGTTFNHIGTGTYQYTFTDPAPNLTYDYWRQLTVDGQTFWEEKQQAVSSFTIPTSRYFTYDKFIARWGSKNVADVYNKDVKGTTPDPVAIQDSFNYADAEIDQAFAGSTYVSPLDFSPWGGQVPPDIARAAMIIAFADGYDVRGWEDKNRVGNKITRLLQQTYDNLALYRIGVKQLNARAAVDSTGTSLSAKADVVLWTDVLAKSGVFWVPDGVLTWNTSYWAS